jgi:hypothetical protein
MPVHAIVTISALSFVPQETITAGMGASRVEGGILILDIEKTFFLSFNNAVGHNSQWRFL